MTSGGSGSSPSTAASASGSPVVSSFRCVSLTTKPEGQVTSAQTVPNSATPTTGSSAHSQNSTSSSSISGGAIGGIVVGSIIGGALIGALILVLYNRSKQPVQAARSMEDGQLKSDQSGTVEKMDPYTPTELASGRLQYPENLEPEVSGNLERSWVTLMYLNSEVQIGKIFCCAAVQFSHYKLFKYFVTD